ncbi:Pkinase-domain-containing protein [Coemansia reversa NRRL 1564]|uniref:Pkinase-domain-containing protein n=1 Tax=Coemansia reversa (strain ATCC 12441 / NRRL 1564) TaxID=763665 RepID=A0A2G5BGQ7_COERN|nr:Pkinase-domain-containing protein [Coemansia reversa NRRL 1564]|eukprot:PIA18162.1 Pkinase-domain-containing protein [Coemansia reversa NRRL 1564]
MAAETTTSVEPSENPKGSCIPASDVRRHISTSSQHSDHTLCSEPTMAAQAAKSPQAVKLGVNAQLQQPLRRKSADEESDTSLTQAIAAASPRVDRRPSLMQRFLGAAAGSTGATPKRVSPAPSVHSSASGTAPHRRTAGSEISGTFEQKYGTCSRECIGRGATAVVRVAYKQHRDGPQVYAIKRFRKQRPGESEREYIKKLTSEYCISSSMHHKNVVSTLDLIQDPQKNWCQVMEYCPGGDLHTVILDGNMGLPEHECCFKQMCQGIAHLHSLGVCHRDIKPENLLLDAHNTLKITDFGVADVFRVAWEERIHKSRGLCGSDPYIAPEMYSGKSYDGRKVDVWSAAIVYYSMVYNGIPWLVAKEEDPKYARFLEAVRNGREYEGFRRIDSRTRRLIHRMLNPDPHARPTMDEVLQSDVLQRICVCDDNGRVPGGGTHSHYTEEFEERMNSRRMRAQAAVSTTAKHHHHNRL